ncbi:MAG: hypothetical protein JJU29_12900 [Verrucomicrobia bacterium]|nr:hypothetical protein [Verrucomicrobiota bacterium]MCH8512592.1 hypothetical protein [Kiritimatiellia bacterium]
MVAFLANDPFFRRNRIMEMLARAEVSGETADHLEVARMLEKILNAVEPGCVDLELEVAMVAAHLQYLGEKDAAHLLLREAGLPVVWCPALTEMVRSGVCSGEIWRMVRAGVLQYAGPGWGGKQPCWRIRGDEVDAVIGPLHELGECLAFRRLGKALSDLATGHNGNLALRVSGVDPRQGQKWVRTLRESLARDQHRLGWHFLPHVLLG